MKLLLLFTCSLSLLFQLPAQEFNTVPLEANISRVDLTPPLELQFSLGGYGDRMNKPVEGVHDSIWVKALILSDGQKKYAIVTLDILALPPNVKPQVLEALTGRFLCEMARLAGRSDFQPQLAGRFYAQPE